MIAMARFFSADMFPAILIGMMALTSVATGIVLLVIGVDGVERALGGFLIACGAFAGVGSNRGGQWTYDA